MPTKRPCIEKGCRRAYYARGRCRKCYHAWQYQNTREKSLAQKKKHYWKNREKILTHQRDRYWEDPEIARKKSRDYYARNSVARKAYAKEYREKKKQARLPPPKPPAPVVVKKPPVKLKHCRCPKPDVRWDEECQICLLPVLTKSPPETRPTFASQNGHRGRRITSLGRRV